MWQGFSGRSAVFGDPAPVDPGCSAALPRVLAAQETLDGGRAAGSVESHSLVVEAFIWVRRIAADELG